MHQFKRQHNIISIQPTRDKSTLRSRNHLVQHPFQPVTSVLVTILYTTLHKPIVQNCVTFVGFLVFGIRQTEVAFHPSIEAPRSSTCQWHICAYNAPIFQEKKKKKSMKTIGPGVLLPSISKRAFLTSTAVKAAPNLSFISELTMGSTKFETLSGLQTKGLQRWRCCQNNPQWL